jgi:hypothetical protein
MVLAGAGGGLRAEVTAGARPPLGLFETPRDGEQPVMAAVTGAQESVDVEVYELTDADLLAALSAQERAGRTVRVILNRNFADANSDVNAMAGEVLQMAGTQVHDANPEFTYTHIKTIIVDAGEPTQKVLIMTMNLDPTYLGKFDAANWVTCAPPEAGDFAAAPGKAVMEAGWFGLEEKTVLAADAEAGMRVWPEVLGLDAFLHYTADPTAYSLSLNFGVIDRDPADVAQGERPGGEPGEFTEGTGEPDLAGEAERAYFRAGVFRRGNSASGGGGGAAGRGGEGVAGAEHDTECNFGEPAGAGGRAGAVFGLAV